MIKNICDMCGKEVHKLLYEKVPHALTNSPGSYKTQEIGVCTSCYEKLKKFETLLNTHLTICRFKTYKSFFENPNEDVEDFDLMFMGFIEKDRTFSNEVLGWVLASDKLPDKSGVYLVRQKSPDWSEGVIQTARYRSNIGEWSGSNAGSFLSYVTHWRKLPLFPEELENVDG